MFVRASKETPKVTTPRAVTLCSELRTKQEEQQFSSPQDGAEPFCWGVPSSSRESHSPPAPSAPYLLKQQRGALPPGALPPSFGAFGKKPHPKADW